VNVSSDTGLPGCAGQNPESRKMVVCVCVCVWCVKNTRIVTTWRWNSWHSIWNKI